MQLGPIPSAPGRLLLVDALAAGGLERLALLPVRVRAVGANPDAAVPYGRVVEVMGVAQKAGLSRIGFVADAKP